jgi:hypothetical protein
MLRVFALVLVGVGGVACASAPPPVASPPPRLSFGVSPAAATAIAAEPPIGAVPLPEATPAPLPLEEIDTTVKLADLP